MTDAGVPFFDLGAQVRPYAAELHTALDEVIESGYFIGGALVDRFERDWAAYVGVPDCVGVGNGLDAIRLILEGYGIGAGDEVIVPAFTYYASWLGVRQAGADLVAVDVDPSTGNIDAAAVLAAIGPSTRAILAVHLYGTPADLVALRRIADDAGVLLIEDAAQSHGAGSGPTRVGAVGDAAAFSFYPTKNLGALGDAGGVTTADEALAARIRSRRSYGQGASKYDHVDTGWNSRLDPMQAAFLRIHLSRLDEFTARRRAIATIYREALADALPSTVGPASIDGSVWHHFVIRLADRDAGRAALAEAGIATDIHYPYSIERIVPLEGAVRTVGETTVSRRFGDQVLSLPMGPWMTDAQVDRVAEALHDLPRALLAE